MAETFLMYHGARFKMDTLNRGVNNAPTSPELAHLKLQLETNPSTLFFINLVPCSEENILHITNHAGPSVWPAIHVLHYTSPVSS